MNVKNNYGRTGLHLAAENGKLEVVKYLLEKGGAEVNVQNKGGWTALHYAAINGHLECGDEIIVGKRMSRSECVGKWWLDCPGRFRASASSTRYWSSFISKQTPSLMLA